MKKLLEISGNDMLQDEELHAMKLVLVALNGLDGHAVNRILEYVTNKIESEANTKKGKQ